MSPPIVIEIAGKPVGKGRGRVGVNKHTGRAVVFTPTSTRQWEGWARKAAQDAMAGRPPLDCPVAVTVRAFLAVPPSWPAWKREAALAGRVLPTTAPDKDNIEKACLDACNGVVYRDDCLVAQGGCIKRYSERPRVVIEVLPIADAAPAQVKRQGELPAPLFASAV